MKPEHCRIADECLEDLRKAIHSIIQRRLDWVKLSEKQRNAMSAQMDHADAKILNASVERVISAVAMAALMESAELRAQKEEAK